MSDQCGFILNDLCYCSDMECYGLKCEYPDLSDCPVHREPDYQTDEVEELTFEHVQKELFIKNRQIELYKKEVTKLRATNDLRVALIKKMVNCMELCDPSLCKRVQEENNI